MPVLPAGAGAAREAGAVGCVLSGGGPSPLAGVAGDGGAAARAMEGALRKAGVSGNARALAVDAEGATSRTR